MNKNSHLKILTTLCLALLVFLLAGCSSHTRTPPLVYEEKPSITLPRLNFTIQVGAFKKINNALRLTKKLKNQGLEAYHFVHPDGLFKVRFGNYRTYGEAYHKAIGLQQDKIFQDFYIVKPENYVAGTATASAETNLRNNIVQTAKRFIGVPYKWGGNSPTEGFDCSGLTMATYRLNGLELPRTSASQFQTGRPVSKNKLQPGDLVFFKTRSRRRVSHVGIYAGNDLFIHAPKQGKTITSTSLSGKYFKKRYVGARRYF